MAESVIVGVVMIAAGGLLLGNAGSRHSGDVEQRTLSAAHVSAALLLILGIVWLGVIFGRQ